jgi:AraC-like DNA-binding protein
VHACEAFNGRWDYRIFYVPAGYVAQLTEKDATSRPGIVRPLIEDAELSQKLLHAHVLAQAEPMSLQADCAMAAAIYAMFGRFADERQREAGRAPRHPAVTRAIDYIHANYSDNIRLDRLAELAHLSPYHFLRAFSRETGLTPHAYLIQVRIQAAAQRLRRGESPLEAAHATGFADLSHLTRTFKRTLGVPPGAFGKISRGASAI